MSDADTLARTIYGEARGELYGGRVAVGNVVMNRVRKTGKSPEEVCRKPYQFSCWNPGDPNRRIIETVSSETDPVFAQCLTIAAHLLDGILPDITFESLHYHTRGIRASWSIGKTPVVQIGNHLFFNDVAL